MPLEGREGGFCRELSSAAAFGRALLDPDVATPTVVAGPKSKAATKRYNVYRNNVTVSLINALAAAFPATLRITGVDFFRAMARFYVRATPPTSPLLFEYGRDFPDFIERYEYAQSVPWLADVARIERAWLDAYHAADVQPLMPRDLAAIPSDRLPNTVLKPYPATRVIRSRFSAVTIFTASRSDGPASRVEVVEPEDAGCQYCMAHTIEGAMHFGVDEKKAAAIWDYQTNPLYTAAERAALDVAVAAASLPNAITDEMFIQMRKHWTEEQIVEIVGVIALFGFLNRWNHPICAAHRSCDSVLALRYQQMGRFSATERCCSPPVQHGV